MKKLLTSAIVFVVVVVGVLFVSFRSTQWEHLLVGATNINASKIPPSIFQFYLEHFTNFDSKTRGDNGLTPIQFLVAGDDM